MRTGDITQMERQKWKGYTLQTYAKRLGRPLDWFKWYVPGEEKGEEIELQVEEETDEVDTNLYDFE